jgi:hypothetical protein
MSEPFPTYDFVGGFPTSDTVRRAYEPAWLDLTPDPQDTSPNRYQEGVGF